MSKIDIDNFAHGGSHSFYKHINGLISVLGELPKEIAELDLAILKIIKSKYE